ncbi:hypothetical protein [Hydrogenivirga sp. 128-5-R1-1]|uniref:hypothetical protein n=1 Tax=Hydrogenivirga sp. 128-5-R1-1 TaxID=392423 RepID=UPI00015EF2E2|nr:hypothetical protein [Hydrogenivirga sp. 128-5-R1-1]EDP73395.1 hypothetical protein HG1285_03794 [Hydrogenivirga sp. 128-5-R1-1]
MIALNLEKKSDKEILQKIKKFLEDEGIEGRFTIIKDDEIKNGYIVSIKSTNIRGIKQAAKKAIELEKKGKNLIKGKYFRFIIH